MELRIGLYEFFAYTLAGGVYFVAVALVTALSSGDLSSLAGYSGLSAVQLIALGVGGYVSALALDLPARILLRAFFREYAQKTVAMRLLKDNIIDPDVERMPWAMVLSEMALRNPSVVRNADSYKAAAILLRNVALAAVVVMAGSGVAAVVGSVGRSTGVTFALGALAVAGCAGWESRKFDTWFYYTLYERLQVARRLALIPEAVATKPGAAKDGVI